MAALAILGHRSAHSFPIGPVIADPAITTTEKEKLVGSKISNPAKLKHQCEYIHDFYQHHKILSLTSIK